MLAVLFHRITSPNRRLQIFVALWTCHFHESHAQQSVHGTEASSSVFTSPSRDAGVSSLESASGSWFSVLSNGLDWTGSSGNKKNSVTCLLRQTDTSSETATAFTSTSTLKVCLADLHGTPRATPSHRPPDHRQSGFQTEVHCGNRQVARALPPSIFWPDTPSWTPATC